MILQARLVDFTGAIVWFYRCDWLILQVRLVDFTGAIGWFYRCESDFADLAFGLMSYRKPALPPYTHYRVVSFHEELEWLHSFIMDSMSKVYWVTLHYTTEYTIWFYPHNLTCIYRYPAIKVNKLVVLCSRCWPLNVFASVRLTNELTLLVIILINHRVLERDIKLSLLPTTCTPLHGVKTSLWHPLFF